VTCFSSAHVAYPKPTHILRTVASFSSYIYAYMLIYTLCIRYIYACICYIYAIYVLYILRTVASFSSYIYTYIYPIHMLYLCNICAIYMLYICYIYAIHRCLLQHAPPQVVHFWHTHPTAGRLPLLSLERRAASLWGPTLFFRLYVSYIICYMLCIIDYCKFFIACCILCIIYTCYV